MTSNRDTFKCAENVQARKQLRLLQLWPCCQRRESLMQQNPNSFVCFSCCGARIAIRTMKITCTPTEVCIWGCQFLTFLVAISNGSHLPKNNRSFKWKKQSKPEYVVFQRSRNRRALCSKGDTCAFVHRFRSLLQNQAGKMAPIISVILTLAARASRAAQNLQ